MLLEALRRALAPAGLNLIGSVATDDYDEGVPEQFHLRKLHPASRSVIVIGNSGGELWQQFRSARPDGAACNDSLDAYTVRTVERAVLPILRRGPSDWRIFYPFHFGAEPVSFLRLAECAGLGRRSLLGILLHPVYGPWMALRAAISVGMPLPASRPLRFDPCANCHDKPCIAACPGNALRPAHGWDVPACARQRQQAPDTCADGCHARQACVYGQEHRYPLDAQQHHQRHSLIEMQRTEMRRHAI